MIGKGRTAVGVFAFALVLVVMPAAVPWAEAEPRYRVTVGAGAFFGQGSEWGDSFDRERLVTGRLGGAVELAPWLEAGVDASVWHAEGTLPLGTDARARQDLTVIPLQAYLVVPLRWRERQLVTPYLGGGYTLFDYRHRVRDVGETRSNRNGYNLRVGLRFALERWIGERIALSLEFVQAGPFHRGDGPPLLGRSLFIGPVFEL